MGGFPPPQLNRLIICRAVVGSHMDIRSVQLPLENIPSANDHRTAAAYRYVYPEMHGATCSSCEWGESLLKAPSRGPAPCNIFINMQFRKKFTVKMLIHMRRLTSAPMSPWRAHKTMQHNTTQHNTQVCSSFQFRRLIQCVVMHYILGTDKSSEILTTNIGKKRGKNNKQKMKKKNKVHSPRKWREQRISGVSISCHHMIK